MSRFSTWNISNILIDVLEIRAGNAIISELPQQDEPLRMRKAVFVGNRLLGQPDSDTILEVSA